MYKIGPSSRFQRDLKKIKKRNYDISLLERVLKKLAAGEELPAKYRDHALIGDFAGCRECHIAPDWLLIYEVRESELILVGHNIIPFGRRVLNA